MNLYQGDEIHESKAQSPACCVATQTSGTINGLQRQLAPTPSQSHPFARTSHETRASYFKLIGIQAAALYTMEKH